MMKKAAVLFCSIFVFSSIAAAAGENIKGKAQKEKNTPAVSVKQETEEYHKKLEMLVKKYDASSENEKISVRNEMKSLVSGYTEKDIPRKKEKLTKDKERIAKQEKEIADIEADKDGHINKEVDFYLSAKGQKKLEKLNEKK